MLFLIATPIGNLGDFSRRAIETLQECDVVLSEDTRHSKILLTSYGIHKPLLAFHQFNEATREEDILERLSQGIKIAMLSDAGTPLISDPGLSLVQACIREKIPFTAIPGPCSVIQALVLSGFDTASFQFIGFLPRKEGSLKEALRRALYYLGTTLAFESPQRLLDTLALIQELDPLRELAVAREMTKTYEECLRGTASQLLEYFSGKTPKGEIVLAIKEGKTPEEPLALEELVPLLQELHGLSLKEAIKLAAKLKQIPKRDVYKKFHS
jgi:16S rRNA (cytidine1402-2'-O)-methyltransferase